MPQVKEFYHDVDLKANQLFNSRLHNITTASRITLGASLSTGDKGYVVYDTDLLSMFLWDGVQWQAAGGGGGIWGTITGVITNQTDLINYLSSNYYPLSSNPAGYLTSETDPVFTAWLATPPNISIFNNDSGYLTSSALTGYVPYTGATGNVDLGAYNLKATRLQVPDSQFGDWSIFTKTAIGWESLKIEDSKNFERVLISGEPGSVGFDNSISVVTSSNVSKLLFPTASNTTLTFPIGTGYLPLNVNGYTADANGAITIPLGTGTVTGTGTATRIAFWDSSSSISSDSDLYWNNTNKSLGIGTASPNLKLDVQGANAVVGIRDTNGTNNSYFGAWTDYLQLSVNRNPATGIFYNTSKAASQISLGGQTSDSHIIFYTANTNNTIPSERVRIDKDGNVGIDTSSPDTKLHIKSSTVPLASIKLEATNALPIIGTITAYPFGQISGTLRIDSDGHIRLASSSSKYEIASTGNHFFGDGFTGYSTNNKFWFKGGTLYVEDRISALTLGVGFNNTLDSSAVFQTNSTTQGVLLTRMTTTQRDAITTPATGLTIYNTVTNKYNYYDGSSWIEMASGSGVGTVTGVTATSPITSSGGTAPVISTSMSTNKLIGRSTAGTGVMEEITVGSGLSLSGGTLSASISGTILKGTTSGTDIYTTTIAGVSSYVDGDAYLIRFVNGNTTGSTLNINGLGAKTLYRNNDGSLIGGDIISGAEMICVFNSTLDGFQTIGTAPNTLLGYVTNDDSVTITKGQVVYAFGGQGDRMTVKLASNTADSTSARTVGVVLSTSIAANQKGLIMMQGLLDGLSILPTATFNDGDPVYLGATAGSITNVKPYAPNHLVYVATVTTASNGSSGRMYINIQNGYELDELHNVQAQSPSLNDTLYYDSGVTPGQWKTASISTILGYTPQAQLNGTGFVKASGTTISYDNNTYLTEDPVILAQQAMGSTIKGVCLACRSFRDLVGGLQPVSGTLYITAYYLSKSSTITGVKFYQSVGGVFTANNFNGFALFTYNAGVLTQVAITANDGNNWKFTSGTTPAIAFTSPYSASAGLYFIAGIYSTSGATTVPIMGHGGTKITTGAANADFTNTARFTATLSSQTSMPSSITLSATTALTTNIAFYLY